MQDLIWNFFKQFPFCPTGITWNTQFFIQESIFSEFQSLRVFEIENPNKQYSNNFCLNVISA